MRGKVNVMLAMHFDSNGVVHYKYAPKGENITKEYYLEFMHWFCDAVQGKWPDL